MSRIGQIEIPAGVDRTRAIANAFENRVRGERHLVATSHRFQL